VEGLVATRTNHIVEVGYQWLDIEDRSYCRNGSKPDHYHQRFREVVVDHIDFFDWFHQEHIDNELEVVIGSNR